jgi:hypothetical protein
MAKSKGISEQNILNELNDIYIPKPSIGDLFIYKEKPMAQETTVSKMETTQTAVEWLAERYNYITWMRNRDEISAGTADEWREKFLKEAKAMEKEQIILAHNYGEYFSKFRDSLDDEHGKQYYNETYNK